MTLTKLDMLNVVIVAFDVDDTLVIWNEDTPSPNWDMINMLLLFNKMPHTQIVVWSGGGIDYAESMGRWLNLPSSVDYAAKMPDFADIAFDDGGDERELTLAKVNILIK